MADPGTSLLPHRSILNIYSEHFKPNSTVLVHIKNRGVGVYMHDCWIMSVVVDLCIRTPTPPQET